MEKAVRWFKCETGKGVKNFEEGRKKEGLSWILVSAGYVADEEGAVALNQLELR